MLHLHLISVHLHQINSDRCTEIMPYKQSFMLEKAPPMLPTIIADLKIFINM